MSQEFHGSVVHHLVPFLVVNAGKEPSIHAHLGKDRHLGSAVSECVDLPSDCRHVFDSECVLYPLMPLSHIVYYVLVISDCFVVHWNTTAYELQLFILYQLSHFHLHFFVLFSPPFLEKCDFHLYFIIKTYMNYLLGLFFSSSM